MKFEEIPPDEVPTLRGWSRDLVNAFIATDYDAAEVKELEYPAPQMRNTLSWYLTRYGFTDRVRVTARRGRLFLIRTDRDVPGAPH